MIKIDLIMDDNKRKILIDNIYGPSDIEDKFFIFKEESDFQLVLAQLDFFKTISGIIIALLSIGYLFDQNLYDKLNTSFLVVSIILAILVFFWTISYIREAIDFHAMRNIKTQEILTVAINETKIKAKEALDSDSWDDYIDYLKNKLKIEPEKNTPLYQGEIFVFLLYLSILFLILSFVAHKFKFGIISCETIISIVVLFLISFMDWSMKLISNLSKVFEKLKKYLK